MGSEIRIIINHKIMTLIINQIIFREMYCKGKKGCLATQLSFLIAELSIYVSTSDVPGQCHELPRQLQTGNDVSVFICLKGAGSRYMLSYFV